MSKARTIGLVAIGLFCLAAYKAPQTTSPDSVSPSEYAAAGERLDHVLNGFNATT